MAKYLVTAKFRLVDEGIYLDKDEIFEPEDKYAQTSRSMAAARRSGWLVQINDEVAAKHQAMMDRSYVQQQEPKKVAVASTVFKPKDLPKLNSDMQPEDLADEVVGNSDAIVGARDKRRQAALKAARPISSDRSVEPVDSDIISEVSTDSDISAEVASTSITKASKAERSEAASIKHEIKSRIRRNKVAKNA
jgi:hypothetical protein